MFLMTNPAAISTYAYGILNNKFNVIDLQIYI